MAEWEFIHLETKEGVARLTLDRPPLNVLNIAAMDEVNRALQGLLADTSLKVLAISGKGRAFSAGVDVADHTEEKVEVMLRQFHNIFHKLAALEAVTVAIVHGLALGGGCELAIFCDLVVASESARFGQPEINVGVFPPIAAVVMPRVLPEKRALELLFTGDTIDGKEAYALGLVSRVVPEDRLASEAEVMIGKLAGKSAPVLRLAKRATLAARGLPFKAAVERTEEIYLKALMSCQDVSEGLSAFMEKRKPVWKNR